MATLMNENYRNAVVGRLTFVSDDGVALVECDDPFVHYTVPIVISNVDYAMLCIDFAVCVYGGVVYRIRDLDDPKEMPWH